MATIESSNWRVRYYWSKSSGLRLAGCDFGGIRAVHSASVPFVYVNYQGDSSGPFTDELQSTSKDVEVREIMRGCDLCERPERPGLERCAVVHRAHPGRGARDRMRTVVRPRGLPGYRAAPRSDTARRRTASGRAPHAGLAIASLGWHSAPGAVGDP